METLRIGFAILPASEMFGEPASNGQVCMLGWRARCADRAELVLRRSCLD